MEVHCMRDILLLISVDRLFLIASNWLVVNQLKIKISKSKIEFDIGCIEALLAWPVLQCNFTNGQDEGIWTSLHCNRPLSFYVDSRRIHSLAISNSNNKRMLLNLLQAAQFYWMVFQMCSTGENKGFQIVHQQYCLAQFAQDKNTRLHCIEFKTKNSSEDRTTIAAFTSGGAELTFIMECILNFGCSSN